MLSEYWCRLGVAGGGSPGKSLNTECRKEHGTGKGQGGVASIFKEKWQTRDHRIEGSWSSTVYLCSVNQRKPW